MCDIVVCFKCFIYPRRVDGEKERSLHLIILYSNGMLVARSFMSRPMDLLLEKQIRLLQERREVEVVKYVLRFPPPPPPPTSNFFMLRDNEM